MIEFIKRKFNAFMENQDRKDTYHMLEWCEKELKIARDRIEFLEEAKKMYDGKVQCYENKEKY